MEYITARYHLTEEKTKNNIREYLKGNNDVKKMYDDGKISIHLIKDGLGGRIAFIEDEIMLCGVNVETLAAISKLVMGGRK